MNKHNTEQIFSAFAVKRSWITDPFEGTLTLRLKAKAMSHTEWPITKSFYSCTKYAGGSVTKKLSHERKKWKKKGALTTALYKRSIGKCEAYVRVIRIISCRRVPG